MAILDNYMFRLLLAIFRLSSRKLKVLLYTLSLTRGIVVLVASVRFEGSGPLPADQNLQT